MAMSEMFRFVQESNRIEGIFRDPTPDELDATEAFATSVSGPYIEDVCGLVSVFAPGHRLRDQIGLDVRVGNYIAPPGGPGIRPGAMPAPGRASLAGRFFALRRRDPGHLPGAIGIAEIVAEQQDIQDADHERRLFLCRRVRCLNRFDASVSLCRSRWRQAG